MESGPDLSRAAERPDGAVRADEAERILVQRLRALDPAAIQSVYCEYADPLYRFALYQTGEPAVAEDLVAEVFLRFIESAPSFEYRGRPVAAWLFRTARNLLVDHHRRRGRRPTVDLDPEVPAQDDPAASAEQGLSVAEVVAALDGLTAEQREVIALRFLEGFDTPYVAALLGKTEGSVKALQHRALAALRRALEGREGGRGS